MSKSKAKGTLFERQVVEYLQANGFPQAERRALAGSNDRGDVSGIDGWVLEVKNHARMELAEWMDEAWREAANAGSSAPGHTVDAAVIHKRRMTSTAGSYVTIPLWLFTLLLRDRGDSTHLCR